MSQKDHKMDVDTIELARMARQDQGDYEMEVCFGDEEADLHVHYQSCKKNPGHKGFIPVKKFIIDDLNPFWKHPLVFETIQLLSDRTVRLVIRGASEARPSHFPFSGRQHKNARRYGTGFSLSSETIEASACSMSNCDILEKHHEYGLITVETAAHVVFDEVEAQNTTVEFFFDDNDRKGVMTARVKDFINFKGHAKMDKAVFTCVTHEKKLIKKMNQLEEKAQYLRQQWAMLPVNKAPSGVTNLAAIASHPHGLSKHISLGRMHMKSLATVYDTFTCPGSSGAAVLNFVDSDPRGAVVAVGYTHSGVFRGMSEVMNKAAETGPVPSYFF